MRALQRSIEDDERRAERERIAKDAVAIRERCKTLIGFVAEFWSILEPKRDFVKGWAVEAVADHLEAVTRGDIQYLLINVPPGMMKSLLVAVFWPAWEWGPMGMGSMGYLASSFGLENVVRDNLKMRTLVESDKFQALWGDKIQRSRKWGERRFANTARGERGGRSFEKMTGGRGDRVIIDDPHDVDGGESDTQRPRAVRTFREAIPDRLNDMQKSAIVVIMQRLHANDVAGTILKLGLPYVHLNLPMEFEGYREENGQRIDARCRTYLSRDMVDGKPKPGATPFFVDPRTEEGELLFPERFPRDVVEGLKKAKGSYAYAGQYQQRPTAREGGLFKRAWFAGQIIDRATIAREARPRCRAWDFAATKEEIGTDPDWSASVFGSRIGTDYYIEHAEQFRETPGMVQKTVVSRAETDPRGTTHRIPVDPAQAGIAQAESYVKAMAGHALKAISTSGRGDKVSRAVALAIQAEFKHIYLVNSGPPDEGLDDWIEPFLDQLCAFPAGSHDDMVDAASDWFAELAASSGEKLDTASAGRRSTVEGLERDSRYQFGDNAARDTGSGWGSARSISGIR